MRHSPPLLLALMLISPLALSAIADDKPTPKEIQDGLLKAAKDYVVHQKSAAQNLTLVETPVLKWVNPERSEQQGVVFLWEKDGLPLAIGSFFTFEYRGLRAKHEFHSLADTPLTTTYKGKAAWSPNEAGVRWTTLADVAPPHAAKALRLTQMKQIARSFEVTLIAPDGDRRKLRLLRTALHRFASPANQISDGGLFAFTVATDPEAVLMIRAKQDQWQFAFARFHYWQLEAKRRDARVWSVPLDQDLETNRLGDQPHLTKVYNSFYPEADYLFRP